MAGSLIPRTAIKLSPKPWAPCSPSGRFELASPWEEKRSRGSFDGEEARAAIVRERDERSTWVDDVRYQAYRRCGRGSSLLFAKLSTPSSRRTTSDSDSRRHVHGVKNIRVIIGWTRWSVELFMPVLVYRKMSGRRRAMDRKRIAFSRKTAEILTN